jgi:hypothetical protein
MCTPASKSAALTDNVCAICRESLFTASNKASVQLTTKGLETVLQYSVLHKDEDLTTYLESKPRTVFVHLECRKKFTNKRRLTQDDRHRASSSDVVGPPAKSLHSRMSQLTATMLLMEDGCCIK